MKKNKPKKKVKFVWRKYIIAAGLFVVLSISYLFVGGIFNKNKDKSKSGLEMNVLYSGIYKMKKVYFVKDTKNVKPIYSSDTKTIEEFVDPELIKLKKEVYRAEMPILWTNEYVGEKSLFMSLNTETENILLEMDLKTGGVKEVLKEEGQPYYSFKVEKVVNNKYLIGRYLPVESNGISDDVFIVNLENNKKIIIERTNIAGEVTLDLEKNRAMFNKVEKKYIDCYGENSKKPECNGAFVEDKKFYYLVPTDKMVGVSLP